MQDTASRAGNQAHMWHAHEQDAKRCGGSRSRLLSCAQLHHRLCALGPKGEFPIVAACRRSANEKNRRRDLVNALRTRREQMLHALKRDQHTASRWLASSIDWTPNLTPDPYYPEPKDKQLPCIHAGPTLGSSIP